jgi:hypothetical protein
MGEEFYLYICPAPGMLSTTIQGSLFNDNSAVISIRFNGEVGF